MLGLLCLCSASTWYVRLANALSFDTSPSRLIGVPCVDEDS